MASGKNKTVLFDQDRLDVRALLVISLLDLNRDHHVSSFSNTVLVRSDDAEQNAMDIDDRAIFERPPGVAPGRINTDHVDSLFETEAHAEGGDSMGSASPSRRHDVPRLSKLMDNHSNLTDKFDIGTCDDEFRRPPFRRLRTCGNCVFQKYVIPSVLCDKAALPAVPRKARSGIVAFLQRDGSRLGRSRQNPPPSCRTAHIRAQDKEPPGAEAAGHCSYTAFGGPTALLSAVSGLPAPLPGPTSLGISENSRQNSERRGSRPGLADEERPRHWGHRQISQKAPLRTLSPKDVAKGRFAQGPSPEEPRRCSHGSFSHESTLRATARQPQL